MLHRSARRGYTQFMNYLGWYGVVAVLAAYALGVFGVLAVRATPYLLLNLTGAAALCAEAYTKKDYQPATLNGIWAAVALISILKLL